MTPAGHFNTPPLYCNYILCECVKTENNIPVEKTKGFIECRKEQIYFFTFLPTLFCWCQSERKYGFIMLPIKSWNLFLYLRHTRVTCNVFIGLDIYFFKYNVETWEDLKILVGRFHIGYHHHHKWGRKNYKQFSICKNPTRQTGFKLAKLSQRLSHTKPIKMGHYKTHKDKLRLDLLEERNCDTRYIVCALLICVNSL